jgi:hypothetical protein
VNEREIESTKAPFRHDLNEAPVAHEFGLNDRGKVARDAESAIGDSTRMEKVGGLLAGLKPAR